MLKRKSIFALTALECGMQYLDAKRGKDGIFHSWRKRTNKTQREDWGLISHRCWGWLDNLALATQFIKENCGDMYEGCYNYMVIERVPMGIVTNIPDAEWWFKWKGDWKTGGYMSCCKPKEFENIVGFWS